MSFVTIAKLKACKTNNTDEVVVFVSEDAHEGVFKVHVVGGLTSGGAEAWTCTRLAAALAFAAEEVRIALTQAGW